MKSSRSSKKSWHGNPEKTFLLETDSYYILRDDNIFFGFERYAHSFPALDQFFKIPSESYVLVPRSQLLTGLLTISVFRTEPDDFVQLHVEGAGTDTRLKMTTRNLAGVPSTTTLVCSRQAKPPSRLGICTSTSTPSSRS